MAKLKGLLNITGKLEDLSMYKMHGVDEIVVRRKGGPTKNMIKNSDSCIRIRENNTEFSTCSAMGREIRDNLQINTYSSDYSSSGKLNALMMQMLKKDEHHDRGMRGICLSQNREMLDGFDFGKNQSFNNVVKKLPEVVVEREQLKARIRIPETHGENHLYNFPGKSWMRYEIRFAIISDMQYNAEREKAVPVNELCHGIRAYYESEWIPAKGVIPGQEVVLSVAEQAGGKLCENDSLVVSVTLHYGDVGVDGKPHNAKYGAVTRIFAVK